MSTVSNIKELQDAAVRAYQRKIASLGGKAHSKEHLSRISKLKKGMKYKKRSKKLSTDKY